MGPQKGAIILTTTQINQIKTDLKLPEATFCRVTVNSLLGFLLRRIHRGPCTQIVYTLPAKYLKRAYFKVKVYAIWIHGPSINPKPL